MEIHTVCPKGQVKISLLITRAKKNSKLLARWHFFQTPIQLADPTQLLLVGVGIDFVFPCHNKKNKLS